jgi:hypothetical protein
LHLECASRQRVQRVTSDQPPTGLGYANRDDLVARLLERSHHCASGQQGYFVLPGTAAEEHADAQPPPCHR